MAIYKTGILVKIFIEIVNSIKDNYVHFYKSTT